MQNKTLAITAISTLTLASLAYFNKEKLSKLITYIWEGDVEEHERQFFLKRLAKISEHVNEFEEEAKYLEEEVNSMTSVSQEPEKSPNEKENDNLSRREKFHAYYNAYRNEEGNEKKENGHIKDKGYYFFSSDGKKIPNKWDTYNVDEALAEIEQEETKKEGNKTNTTKEKQPENKKEFSTEYKNQTKKQISVMLIEIEKIYKYLDLPLSGPLKELKGERKCVTQRVTILLNKLEELKIKI